MLEFNFYYKYRIVKNIICSMLRHTALVVVEQGSSNEVIVVSLPKTPQKRVGGIFFIRVLNYVVFTIIYFLVIFPLTNLIIGN